MATCQRQVEEEAGRDPPCAARRRTTRRTARHARDASRLGTGSAQQRRTTCRPCPGRVTQGDRTSRRRRHSRAGPCDALQRRFQQRITAAPSLEDAAPWRRDAQRRCCAAAHRRAARRRDAGTRRADCMSVTVVQVHVALLAVRCSTHYSSNSWPTGTRQYVTRAPSASAPARPAPTRGPRVFAHVGPRMGVPDGPRVCTQGPPHTASPRGLTPRVRWRAPRRAARGARCCPTSC